VTDTSVPTDRQYEFRYFGGTPRQGETQPPLQNLIAVSASSATSKPQFIFFADEGNNQVDGTTNQLGDHLYGGAGNDVVNGLGGADYLEGNVGADSLNGGEGADLLLGGVGADTLDGGTGAYNDTLNGGADADLYIVGKDAGVDTLASSDAGDRLKLGNRTLPLNGSGTFVSSSNGVTVWQDSSVTTDPITYSLDTTSQVLTIKGAHSIVLVKDFVDSDLGISVPAAPPAPPPPTTTAAGDLSANTSYGWRDDGFAAIPAGSAEHIFNFNIWHVTPEVGVLTIDARGGNDWIEGGAGVSGLPLQITAGSGNDQVYATTTQTLAVALAAQDVAVATGRSDLLLDGGSGDDSVFGGAGDDALFGGDGADTIVGGAGRDVIFSDGDSGRRFADAGAGFKWVAGDQKLAIAAHSLSGHRVMAFGRVPAMAGNDGRFHVEQRA
jgi:Ca2+-binding RTX toxin-like protein